MRFKKWLSRIATVLWSSSVVQAVIRLVDNVSRIDTIHGHFSTAVGVLMSPISTLVAVVMGALMLWYASLAKETESLLELPANLKIERTRFPKKLVLWSLSMAIVCGVLLSGILKWLPHGVHVGHVLPQAAVPAAISMDAQATVRPPASQHYSKTGSRKGVTVAALRSREQRSWTTDIDQTYDWSKPIKKVGPPSQADADSMRPGLAEADRIREMDPKQRISYYHQQSRDFQLFYFQWTPKENDYDSESCQSPTDNTPQAQKRCDELNKLENARLSNYQQYRYHDLPKARDENFRDSFPLINAQIEVMQELCQKKGITASQPSVTAENAYGISEYFRTYTDQCAGGD